MPAESLRVALEGKIAFHDHDALAGFADAHDIHRKGKAVQQLRAQLAFLRVHRADEDEAGRMGERDAFAFHHVDAHGRRIQQHIHHVVVEQVHFVNVEQAAVGVGQHARLKMTLAFLDGLLDIQRADHAVFGGRDGQVHEGRGPAVIGEALLADGDARGIPCTRCDGLSGSQPKRQSSTTLTLREQGRQGAGGSGFGCAAFAAYQYSADAGIHRIENQGAAHAFLANYGCERIDCRHINSAADYIAGDYTRQGEKVQKGLSFCARI